MQNVKTSQRGTKLTIEVDLAVEGKVSVSGKSIVLASTHGNPQIGETDKGPVFLGLNLYIRNPEYKKNGAAVPAK